MYDDYLSKVYDYLFNKYPDLKPDKSGQEIKSYLRLIPTFNINPNLENVAHTNKFDIHSIFETYYTYPSGVTTETLFPHYFNHWDPY